MIKYAVDYAKDFRHFNDVDEIILNHYSGSEQLVEFITNKLIKKNNKSKQRVVINLLDITHPISEVIVYIQKLIHDGYNMAAIIYDDKEMIEQFKTAKIPFFFIKYATNLEMAYTMAEVGVSDIYVVEELGFRLEDLKYIKDKYKVNIRVFPNIAQSAKNSRVKGTERFWIRPEDTNLYEDYVDIFELKGGEDLSRLSVVFEIYKQRQWLGNLNDLILDFDEPIVPNTGLDPHFGITRRNCGKKCLQGKCYLCSDMAELAVLFNTAGLEIVKPMYKPEIPQEEKEKLMKEMKDITNEHRTNKKSNNSETTSVDQSFNEVSEN